jgi:hypothetical protein
MLYVEDYIHNSVHAENRQLAIEISKELSNLLRVLDQNGYLREKLSGTITENRQIIVEAQRNNDSILAAFNKYYDFYFKLGKREKYLEFMRNNGFTDIELGHLLHSQMIFVFLANMEIFKNLFNLILRESSSSNTLGHLFGNKGILCNSIIEGKTVAQRLDIELRNALSHYTFTEEGKSICYYAYSYNKEKQSIVLKQGKILSTDLYQKTIEVSLMKAILGCLIADWYNLPVIKQ